MVFLIKSENNKLRQDTFHRAIGPILFVGQCFGIMPVIGILNNNIKNVKFKWLTFRMIVTAFIIITGFIENIFAFLTLSTNEFNIGRAGATIFFFFVVLISNILFLCIAKDWPHIIRVWQQSELIFLSRPYHVCGWRLTTKIRFIGFLFIIFAAFEHIMYITSTIYNNYKFIENCKLNVNFLENLYKRERPHLMQFIPYNNLLLIPLVFITLSNTFCWTFIDLFIIIISIGLAKRFNQLNSRLRMTRGKIMPESFWIEIRSHYITLAELLNYIDTKVSIFILISCSNNLYVICVQLFNSFSLNPKLLNKIYFWISLLFVIFRTLSMLFFAASVHDATKKPLYTLRAVPSKSYSIEVQRFTDQVTHEIIALSGKRFFYLTRKLILGVIGTIATYELVLLDEVKIETVVTQCPNITSTGEL